MTLIYLIVAAIVLLGVAYAFRMAGQAATSNQPFFRDMPFGVAYGYVLGAVLLLLGIWLFFQPQNVDGVPQAGVMFFRWAVQIFIIFAIAAYVFRLLGRSVGTEGSKKLFRSMPLTAAFGIFQCIL